MAPSSITASIITGGVRAVNVAARITVTYMKRWIDRCGRALDPVLVRRALLLLVLGACTSTLPTAETSSQLVGAPEGTTTFPSTQVGATSAAQTYYIYEITNTV